MDTVYTQERQGYGAIEALPGETMMETAEAAGKLALSAFDLSAAEDEVVQWIKSAGGEETAYRIFDITVTVTVKATEA